MSSQSVGETPPLSFADPSPGIRVQLADDYDSPSAELNQQRWTTFRNAKCHFELEYPPEWIIYDDSELPKNLYLKENEVYAIHIGDTYPRIADFDVLCKSQYVKMTHEDLRLSEFRVPNGLGFTFDSLTKGGIVYGALIVGRYCTISMTYEVYDKTLPDYSRHKSTFEKILSTFRFLE